MIKKLTALGKIFKKTFKAWAADDPFRQSAVIAYYAIFSLPALLVLIINVAGIFFEHKTVSGEISRQINDIMGEQTARSIENIVERAGETQAGFFPGMIAVITILFGATGVFVQLQKSLNHVWEVREKPRAGFMLWLRRRLFSFGLIVSIGFLLLVSLVISTVLAAVSHWVKSVFPDVIAYLFYLVDLAVSVSVISVLFALMFKYLPDVKMSWRNTWVGAFLTGLLFVAGKYGLSLYFGKAEPASVYGAAGSVILILLWVSYSSMIVFFGAEFTRQYALYYGHKITVKSNAEPIHETRGRLNQDEENKRESNLHNKTFHDREEKFSGSGNGHFNGTKSGEMDEEQTNPEDKKNETKSSGFKIKSVEEIRQMIERKERRLEQDKEGIADNLQLSAILTALIPKAWRHNKNHNGKLSVDEYLRALAKKHISAEDETLLEKIKEYLKTNGNGST